MVVWTVVGVPGTTVDMIPKDLAIVSPAGSAPDTIFHVSSDEPPPLFAVMKAVYDAHTFPLGIDVVVIISGVIVGVGVAVPGEVVDVGWGVAVAWEVVEVGWGVGVGVGCDPVGVEVGAGGEPVGGVVDWGVDVGLGVLCEPLALESPVVFVPAEIVAAIMVVATRIRKPSIKLCL